MLAIFTDKISGSVSERPGLEKVENFLRAGDVLVVWRLDRLGRSLKHLISYVSKLEENGIGFHSLTEAINTETPSGKFMFHVFGALSEFERNLIKVLLPDLKLQELEVDKEVDQKSLVMNKKN